MQPFDLLAYALATWYLAHVTATLDGPFSLLKRLRDRKYMGGLFECVYCLAPYVGAVVYLTAQNEYGRYGVEVFAIAGAALMLRTYTGAGMHGN